MTDWDQYLSPSKQAKTTEQFPEWAQKATDNRLRVEAVRSLAKMALINEGLSEQALRGYLRKIVEECGPEAMTFFRT